MTREELIGQIKRKRSFLCVGLDPDALPESLPKQSANECEALFAFNKALIDATAPFAVAFKPNLAFYEARGWEGMQALERTVEHLNENYPELFLIADAKRGDIGNTTKMYARAFFEGPENRRYDAVTIAPYMGRDSVDPFLGYPGRWAVLLALTSNPSAADFETETLASDRRLYEEVLEKSSRWASPENLMYVVGATQAAELGNIRRIVPDHFLLVPGVGAQGGSLSEVARYGMNRDCGLLVNSSRGIIYASKGEDFAEAAARAARQLQTEMEQLLDRYGVI